MKLFLRKVTYFALIILILTSIGLFLPTTPRVSESLLFGAIQKDSLLKNVESPRIIFVGGSNLSFGINSQMIKDSLGLNPINTAIHAAIGLKYMMENTLQYVREGDIVVLAPEYDHFYRKYDVVSEELMRMVFDVNFSNFKLLNFKQKLALIPHIPKYSLSKFKPNEYMNVKVDEIYSVRSFNQYGDVGIHREPSDVIIPAYIMGKYNDDIVKQIKKFHCDVIAKGAILIISYQCHQDISFLKDVEKIKYIEQQFIDNGLITIGTPERYTMPNSLMYDLVGHLNTKGADYRTNLFIEDIRKANIITR